jgi:hypothetical protein
MKDRIFIAIPSGKSAPDVDMSCSLTDTMFHLYESGMRPERRIVHGNCYVHLCRTQLVHQFMKTDCSHILFWDDDVAAPPGAARRLLNYDRDVVVAPYPKKVPAGTPPEKAWPYVLTDGVPDPFGLLKCEKVATGFLLIRRNVIETLYKIHAAERTFLCDTLNDDVIDLFPTGLIPGFPLDEGKQRWWGEDYAFSILVGRAGFQIWLDPVIPLIHVGRQVWRGEFTKNADAAYTFEAAANGRAEKGSPFASQPPHMPAQVATP